MLYLIFQKEVLLCGQHKNINNTTSSNSSNIHIPIKVEICIECIMYKNVILIYGIYRVLILTEALSAIQQKTNIFTITVREKWKYKSSRLQLCIKTHTDTQPYGPTHSQGATRIHTEQMIRAEGTKDGCTDVQTGRQTDIREIAQSSLRSLWFRLNFTWQGVPQVPFDVTPTKYFSACVQRLYGSFTLRLRALRSTILTEEI